MLEDAPKGSKMCSHNVIGTDITATTDRSCVFISHRRADKPIARQLAQYFDFLGLLYYFDEQDIVLNRMLAEGHSSDRALVETIEAGLRHSSHLLGVLSMQTMGSWWVPFEIGAARALRQQIAHLIVPDVAPASLPEYVRIVTTFWTAEELFAWAGPMAKWPGGPVNRSLRDWWEREGGGLFAELGPPEEEVEDWYEFAAERNARYLQELNSQLAVRRLPLSFDAK
jgi:hypothetical protein